MAQHNECISENILENHQELIDKMINLGWKRLYMTKKISTKGKRIESVSPFVIFYRQVRNPITYENRVRLKLNQNSQKSVWYIPNYHYQENDKIPNPASLQQFEENKNINPNHGMGDPYENGGLCKNNSPDEYVLSQDFDVESLPSISSMRRDTQCFCIGVDTEFRYSQGCRRILSWQFSFVDPEFSNMVQELIAFPTSKKKLSLYGMLAFIIDNFKIYSKFPCQCNTPGKVSNGVSYSKHKEWRVPHLSPNGKYSIKRAATYEKALIECYDIPEYYNELKRVGPDYRARETSMIYVSELGSIPVGYRYDIKSCKKDSLNVLLICHSGKADLSTFHYSSSDRGSFDILRYVSEINGGLCTINSFIKLIPVYSVANNRRFYPVKIGVRDTMCFAPGKHRSLGMLGKAINVEKKDIPETYTKNDMRSYLIDDIVGFSEYAVNDSVIALLYSSELWKYNMETPTTISAAACCAAVNSIKNYFNIDRKNDVDFNLKYRGLKRVPLGSVKNRSGNIIGASTLAPLTDDCRQLQDMAKNAYKGGYNGSLIIGYASEKTYDYDLKNAYPTCMSLIPDVDWESDQVVYNEQKNIYLDFNMIRNPFSPVFAYVTFEFPEGSKHTCIPVSSNGNVIFPRRSTEAVYVSCPEIYLALMMGAKVFAKRVVFGSVKYVEGTMTPSRSLSNVVKQFIRDRALVRESLGKGSLYEMLLKECVSSIYGKSAQNIIDKSTWSVKYEKMVSIGDSALTSPVHSCLTTAGIRCLIIAAITQITNAGYKVYSVTTDGFISNIPFEELKKLDLFGFAYLFRRAREELTGNDSLWEVKHEQDDLLNITTRGNVSLNIGDDSSNKISGVVAHNSYRTGFTPDSFEDRFTYANNVIKRKGKILSHEKVFTSFKKMSSTKNREDFSVIERERHVSMDFDLKRKPIRDSFENKKIKADKELGKIIESSDGEDVAYFETEPYEDVNEYNKYKACARNITVLKTCNDWEQFFNKLDLRTASARVHTSDLKRAALVSCIIVHKQGIPVAAMGNKPVKIPYLDRKIHIDEKIKWINEFNKSSKKFTKGDWYHCGEKSRSTSVLPEDFFIDLLKKMVLFGE